MKLHLVALAIVGSSSVAFADVRDGNDAQAHEITVGVNGTIGGGSMAVPLRAGAAVEATAPWRGDRYFHAVFGTAAPLFGGTGYVLQARAGVEDRKCLGEGQVCAFGSLDAGLQRESFLGTSEWFSTDGMTEIHTGPVLGPTVGLDVGSKNVRMRASWDVLGVYDISDNRVRWSSDVSLGLAGRF